MGTFGSRSRSVAIFEIAVGSRSSVEEGSVADAAQISLRPAFRERPCPADSTSHERCANTAHCNLRTCDQGHLTTGCATLTHATWTRDMRQEGLAHPIVISAVAQS